ncbi:MAG: hypothetical protein ACE5IK_07550, partial [Acidobacteriota bacterium]
MSSSRKDTPRRRLPPRQVWATVLWLLLVAGPAGAGGPALVGPGGTPLRWPDGGRDIGYNPDRGGLGPFDHATILSLADAAWQRWEDVPSATATFRAAAELPVDIDATNFVPLLFGFLPDGVSPVIWDEDGSIFEILFGRNSLILGTSGPEFADPDGHILESQALFNGGFENVGFPPSEYLQVLVHEFGHFINLGHSIVNGQIIAFDDENGPTPLDLFPRENLAGRIETMSVQTTLGSGQDSPGPDDVASISFLYPADGYAGQVGTITGSVLGPDGVTPLSGVNVIARNIESPFDDAISSVSSE